MIQTNLFFLKLLLFSAIIFTIMLILRETYLSKGDTKKLESKELQNYLDNEIPVVLWWTPLIANYYRTNECGAHKCIFTVDRKYFAKKNTKALVFYGSDFNITDLPLPRQSNHLWALYHEESPKNLPLIQFEKVIDTFNITSTFSRYSSFPLTTQYLQNLTTLRSRKFMQPIGEKSRLRRIKKLAPIAFVQSICDTMSGRDDFVLELMKYIKVDSYGHCLNNKKLPTSLSVNYLQKMDSEDFYKFLSRYKFIIAYENGVCNDYISEKIWRPLVIGVIPIYFGSPTIKDWLPNEKSAIVITDFDGPKDLAEYLHYLDKNDVEYNKHLDHKYSQSKPISNKLLENTLLTRSIEPDFIVNGFECFICKKVHEHTFFSIANRRHYDCPSELQFPPGIKKNVKLHNNWNSIMGSGKCEAKVLDYFLALNSNYTAKDFSNKFLQSIRSGICTFGNDVIEEPN